MDDAQELATWTEVLPLGDLLDPVLAAIDADYAETDLGLLDRERKPDVTEPDHAYERRVVLHLGKQLISHGSLLRNT